MKQKLILFDCDETLWESKDADYISSKNSRFKKKTKDTIIRVADHKELTLKKGVFEAFKLLESKKNFVVGIVSDNKKDSVIEALKLFNLWKHIKVKATSIKLWDGYCPKHEMINDILKDSALAKIPRNYVYWFDDEDYAKEASRIGVNFHKVDSKTNLIEIIQDLL